MAERALLWPLFLLRAHQRRRDRPYGASRRARTLLAWSARSVRRIRMAVRRGYRRYWRQRRPDRTRAHRRSGLTAAPPPTPQARPDAGAQAVSGFSRPEVGW